MLRSATLATVLAVLVSPAHADDSAAMRQIVAGAVKRAHRAFAGGPLVGGAVAYVPSASHRDYPIAFGIGVALFKIPIVPDVNRIREITIERTKAKVTEQVADRVLSGSPPDGDEIAAMARETAQEIAKQVIDELSAPPKIVETPRLAVDLEGEYLPVGKAWQLRLTAGIGISKITLGPTMNINLSSPRGLFLGGELAVHLMAGRGPRPPLIDLYLRYDAGVTSAARHANTITLGTRLLIDFL